MNLGELKTRVIQKLRERPTPRHWTEAEITENINEGTKQLARDVKAREALIPLVPVDLAHGLFAVPGKIMHQGGVFWEGQELAQTTTRYMDSYYKGYRDTHTIGAAERSMGDWRQMTAEKPTKWMIDDGMIRLFPIPEAFASANPIRRISSGTLLAGTTDIPLEFIDPVPYEPIKSSLETTKIAGSENALMPGDVYGTKDPVQTFDQVRFSHRATVAAGNNITVTMTNPLAPAEPPKEQIAFFLNGLRQRDSEWIVTFAGSNMTVRLDPLTSLGADALLEVVVLDMPCENYESSLSAGDTDITCAGATLEALGQLISVYLDGIYQHTSQWTVVDDETITMVGALSADADVEVVVEKPVEYLQPRRYQYDLATMGASIPIHGRHQRDISSFALFYNGVKQADNLLTEDDTYSLAVPAAGAPGEAEITVYRWVFPAGWVDSALEMFSAGRHLYHDDFYVFNSTTIKSFARLANQAIELVQWNVGRLVWSQGFLVAGTMDIAVPGLGTNNQGVVDVYMDGKALNKLEWEFTSTGIRLLDVPPYDYFIEIARVAAVPDYEPVKYLLPITAGQATVEIPAGPPDTAGYVVGGHSLALFLNGEKIYQSRIGETTPHRIDLSPTLSAGELELVVYDRNALSSFADKPLIDFFLSGVYQNQDQWNIINPGILRLVGPEAIDLPYEIVFWGRNALNGIRVLKYTLDLPAGIQSFATPRPYEVGNNAVSLRINGITQAPSSFTETSANRITLAAPLAFASAIEITIYDRFWAGSAAIKCVRMPEPMVVDGDVPDLPTHMEAFHDAIWMWALFECFSREGQEKDMAMAQFYAGRYSGVVNNAKLLFDPPMEVTPRDAWVV